MFKKEFGVHNPMVFTCKDSFYETIGFLANPSHKIEFVYEKNHEQGAWGPEYRIHCMRKDISYPSPLNKKLTAGVGNIAYRINCNEFIEMLISKYCFEIGKKVQNTKAIREKIPEEYVESFLKGFNVK